MVLLVRRGTSSISDYLTTDEKLGNQTRVSFRRPGEVQTEMSCQGKGAKTKGQLGGVFSIFNRKPSGVKRM